MAVASEADRTNIIPISGCNRSALSNGPLHALGNIDGRSATARRFRDLTMAFADDLGGPDRLNEFDKALIRNAAASVIASDQLQQRIVAGEAVNPDEMVRLANMTSRLIEQIRKRFRGGGNAPAGGKNRKSSALTLAESLAQHGVTR